MAPWKWERKMRSKAQDLPEFPGAPLTKGYTRGLKRLKCTVSQQWRPKVCTHRFDRTVLPPQT